MEWNLLGVFEAVSGGPEGAEVDGEIVVEWAHATSRVAELYAAHAPQAGRLAYLLTGDPDLAQDLAQEGFARLITRLRSLRNPEAVEAYLRRSVIILARKHWRRMGRERAYLRREGPLVTRSVTDQPDLSDRDALWRGLDRLPYRQRAALVLRFFEDLSERQIAEALGCARGTVKSSVSRGLEKLRAEIRGEER